MSPARTVLITGGTGSLGTATVRALGRRAAAGWHAVVTGRDAARTAARAEELTARSGLPVTPLALDLESLDAVRAFARDWPGRGLPPLHALVCNAGTMVVSGTRRTADGNEVTFAVNHLAHFLLVELLRPHLVAPARIILIASDTHDPARRHGFPPPRLASARDLAAGNGDGHGGGDGDGRGVDPREEGRRRYTTSKLCAVLLAYELDRRLDAPDTTANAFDPGLMPGTGLARDYHPVFRFAWRYLMPALTVLPRNFHTARTSGAALARLIDDPALDGVSGRYFRGRHEARSSEQSYDRVAAAELWRGSVELAGVVAPAAGP